MPVSCHRDDRSRAQRFLLRGARGQRQRDRARVGKERKPSLTPVGGFKTLPLALISHQFAEGRGPDGSLFLSN